MLSAPRAVWQVSGGPANRAYADVFLKYGVALVGPGDSGPWRPDRDDSDDVVCRFATEVRVNDVILLRTGIAAIGAVERVTSEYLYLPQFDDVSRRLST